MKAVSEERGQAFYGRTIKPLRPDIIATIGPWFVDRERVDAKYRDVVRGCTGELQDAWLECCREYRAAYGRPVDADRDR